MKRVFNEKGFTLVELLIVIVIIGILAGVLISIINPAQQQNRARDAGVQASINKVALAVEGFISAYGRTPTDTELIGSIQNSSPVGVTCADGAAEEPRVCEFEIVGNTLPANCGANFWSAAGANQCAFHYYGEGPTGATPTHFRLVAKSHGQIENVFVYDNTLAEIFECDVATVDDIDTAGLGDGDNCE